MKKQNHFDGLDKFEDFRERMNRKMPIFHYNNQMLTEVEKTTFGKQGVLERDHLQAALKRDISVISDDLLIISEEFSEWSEGQRRIDLLAVDKLANIVVIELKRSETGDLMELQAIRYASMISTLTWQETIKIFSRFLKIEYPQEDRNAERELLDFLDWTEAQEDDFGSETHIVLISANFSPELTTAVMWLNDSGLNIKCVQIRPHKFDDKVLINVQQLIPLPEAEDYQVRVRRKDEERKVARYSNRDLTKYLFNGIEYNKRRLVLAVVKNWVESHSPENFDELKNVFPQDIRPGGVFVPLSEADEYYFTDEEDRFRFDDGSTYVLSKMWGGIPHKRFIDIARNLGFEIEALD